ncbi:hypothetical protein VTK56DRAFT_481 [Thermocarpiscus australiensis]
MTPPASQCCRALQRQIIPSGDSVWIADGLLASAFERYCLVSRTWNRKASNVPGPLESQRRLGRRRIGDASTWHCPPTPPPWAFPVPLDLSKWNWEPPTLSRTAEQGRPRQDEAGAGPLTTSLSRWLQEWLPRDADELSPLNTDEPPVAVPLTFNHTSPSIAAAVRNPQSFAADMDTFRWAAAHATAETFASYAEEICRKFQQRIFLGEVPPEDILPISAETWGLLESRYQGSPLGHRLCLSLSMAILTASKTSRVFSPSLLDVGFWNALLTQMSKLPVDDGLCNLFIEVMATMPTIYHNSASEGILSVLRRFFSAWSCSQDGRDVADIFHLLDINLSGRQLKRTVLTLSKDLRQARAVSKALEAVSPEDPSGLLDAANRLALDQAAFAEKGRHAMRYNWLCVLAQMPHVNQDFLFDAAAGFSDRSFEMTPLTDFEVCSLLLTQWASRGYLKSASAFYHTFKRYCAERDEAALASLFVTIFRHGGHDPHKGLYYSVWKLLVKLNRTDDAVTSLKFDARSHKLPLQLLQELAYASNDHYIAIRLRDLYARRLKDPDGRDWDPGVFKKYAERIVLDPSIPPKAIWRVLDINRLDNQRKDLWEKTRRHLGTYGERRAAIVEKVSAAFATAPHLSTRVAFRHVSQCFWFILKVRGRPSFAVIQDLYRVVSKDLLQLQPGRTKRLLWFLSVVERHYGLSVAWACRLALRSWRARLKKIWLSTAPHRRD